MSRSTTGAGLPATSPPPGTTTLIAVTARKRRARRRRSDCTDIAGVGAIVASAFGKGQCGERRWRPPGPECGRCDIRAVRIRIRSWMSSMAPPRPTYQATRSASRRRRSARRHHVPAGRATMPASSTTVVGRTLGPSGRRTRDRVATRTTHIRRIDQRGWAAASTDRLCSWTNSDRPGLLHRARPRHLRRPVAGAAWSPSRYGRYADGTVTWDEPQRVTRASDLALLLRWNSSPMLVDRLRHPPLWQARPHQARARRTRPGQRRASAATCINVVSRDGSAAWDGLATHRLRPPLAPVPWLPRRPSSTSTEFCCHWSTTTGEQPDGIVKAAGPAIPTLAVAPAATTRPMCTWPRRDARESLRGQ